METHIKMDDLGVFPYFGNTHRWWFETFLIFIPKIGEMIQFDEHIFSDGLVQPPTSFCLQFQNKNLKKTF